MLDFLTADYTFVNGRLAKFYGMPGRGAGKIFKRSRWRARTARGVLTQASVLALTSNPTRTSPVKRGKWVLENLLGAPPPPPPPDVPSLDDKSRKLTGTLREQMVAAPAESGLRLLPRAHGSDRFQPGEFQRHRRVARQGRRRRRWTPPAS